MVDIRRSNVRQLVASVGHGRQNVLAEKADMPPALVSQVLNGTRNIGEKLARKIETRLGLETYALDVPLGSDPQERELLKIDAEVLAEIISGTQKAARLVGLDWRVDQVAKMAASLYALWQATGEMPNFEQAARIESLRQG